MSNSSNLEDWTESPLFMCIMFDCITSVSNICPTSVDSIDSINCCISCESIPHHPSEEIPNYVPMQVPGFDTSMFSKKIHCILSAPNANLILCPDTVKISGVLLLGDGHSVSLIIVLHSHFSTTANIGSSTIRNILKIHLLRLPWLYENSINVTINNIKTLFHCSFNSIQHILQVRVLPSH